MATLEELVAYASSASSTEADRYNPQDGLAGIVAFAEVPLGAYFTLITDPDQRRAFDLFTELTSCTLFDTVLDAARAVDTILAPGERATAVMTFAQPLASMVSNLDTTFYPLAVGFDLVDDDDERTDPDEDEEGDEDGRNAEASDEAVDASDEAEADEATAPTEISDPDEGWLNAAASRPHTPGGISLTLDDLVEQSLEPKVEGALSHAGIHPGHIDRAEDVAGSIPLKRLLARTLVRSDPEPSGKYTVPRTPSGAPTWAKSAIPGLSDDYARCAKTVISQTSIRMGDVLSFLRQGTPRRVFEARFTPLERWVRTHDAQDETFFTAVAENFFNVFAGSLMDWNGGEALQPGALMTMTNIEIQSLERLGMLMTSVIPRLAAIYRQVP